MSLSIRRVETKEARAAARDFVNAHHSYIAWADRPSRKIYWTLFEDNRLVGVWGLASGFVMPKAISRYMLEHGIEFNEVGNNIVYALHGQSRNAGSAFLSMLRADAIRWWAERYGDTLRMFQTFILPPRTGSLYKADNWVQLGCTTGGRTLSTRTLYGEEREKHPGAEIRKMKNGETKYLLRTFTESVPKLIFVKLASKRPRRAG